MQHNEKNVRDQALSVFESLIIASCAGIQSWHGEFISIESIGNSQRKSSHDWTSPKKTQLNATGNCSKKLKMPWFHCLWHWGLEVVRKHLRTACPYSDQFLSRSMSVLLCKFECHIRYKTSKTASGCCDSSLAIQIENKVCTLPKPSTHNVPNAANPRYMIVRVRFQSAIALDVLYSDACKIFSFKKRHLPFWSILGESKGLLTLKQNAHVTDHRLPQNIIRKTRTEIKEKSLSHHLAMALSPVCLANQLR